MSDWGDDAQKPDSDRIAFMESMASYKRLSDYKRRALEAERQRDALLIACRSLHWALTKTPDAETDQAWIDAMELMRQAVEECER